MNTGLGWEAPASYLVYNANTYLGHAASRYYFKTNSGYALSFYLINKVETGSWWSDRNWHGPCLISTDNSEDNNQFYYDESTLGTSYSIRYLGHVWHINVSHHMSTEDYDTGGSPVLSIVTKGTQDETVAAIKNLMNSIGVRPYVSQRGKSFISGLAVGLATKAWITIGEAMRNLIAKFVTRNGTYSAVDDGVDGYSSVVVNVPNSYSSLDEGKVVENGSLVAQTAKIVTTTGTYTTTYNNSVVVDIPLANGVVF